MDDKIKEVMRLVVKHGERCCEDNEFGHQEREDAIESKLRELVPVWLPIESAPKGKTFLVRGGQWHGEVSGPSPNDIAIVSYDGGQFSEVGGDYYSSWIENPTHWMPLP